MDEERTHKDPSECDKCSNLGTFYVRINPPNGDRRDYSKPMKLCHDCLKKLQDSGTPLAITPHRMMGSAKDFKVITPKDE